MMRVRSIRYYINEAFISLFRNRLMALASIITVASCIFSVVISFCIAINLDDMLKQIENSITLTVYIDDKLGSEQVNELFFAVKELEHVKGVKYVSAEDALKSFEEDLGNQSSLVAGLEKDNPLPRSFNIEVEDSIYQAEIVEQLEGMADQGIYDIRYQQHIVEALTTVSNGIRIVSIIVILVLLMTSVIIIINTIRITVSNRKLEINIMKYVGATDWFIRWPFIIEGMLIGVIGSTIPTVICWLCYGKTVDIIYEQMPILKNLITFKPGIAVFPTVIPLALMVGIMIGVAGSVVSVRKHLHV